MILDGVDEAAHLPLGPDLIPRDLPSSTRVVLSVRSSAHLDGHQLCAELGWPLGAVDRRALAPLDLEAARSLVAAHLPTLADDAEVAQRLYHLADEGDPLLLGLLLDEWAADGPDADGPSEPGLAGLWSRQLRRTERLALADDAGQVVAALASTIGPMHRDDLLELLGGGFTPMALDAALELVGRFVLQPSPGVYVFCHARLRQHVEEATLGRAAREDWQRRIVRWAMA